MRRKQASIFCQIWAFSQCQLPHYVWMLQSSGHRHRETGGRGTLDCWQGGGRHLEKLMRSHQRRVWQYFLQQVEESRRWPHLQVHDIYLINSWLLWTCPWKWPSDTDHSQPGLGFIRGNGIILFNAIHPSWHECVFACCTYMFVWGSGQGLGWIVDLMAILRSMPTCEMTKVRKNAILIIECCHAWNELMKHEQHIMTCTLVWHHNHAGECTHPRM